ncbi:hypothetical protein J4216_01470 [Candidatus Woesearchaeota archaeon]|nr:hypothetical protein [Candidatus Woesearchaeota archaeon]
MIKMTNKTKRIKQKTLLPSLKEKKRYLVYETLSSGQVKGDETKEVITNSFKELFGLEGLAMAGLNFVEFKDNKGIIRVNNKSLDMLRASFCFIGKINKEEAIVRSVGVSGMLKKARIKFMSGGRF